MGRVGLAPQTKRTKPQHTPTLENGELDKNKPWRLKIGPTNFCHSWAGSLQRNTRHTPLSPCSTVARVTVQTPPKGQKISQANQVCRARPSVCFKTFGQQGRGGNCRVIRPRTRLAGETWRLAPRPRPMNKRDARHGIRSPLAPNRPRGKTRAPSQMAHTAHRL